ncbi:MAG TPA: hypothetical protein VH856_04960 [Steroidobacteraceae bacterium]|jgi:outer membrane lipoprotein SlyB
MSTTEYRQRHWLAWSVIGGVALISVAALGATQGWLPGPGGAAPAATCAECAIVEAVSSDPFGHEVVVRFEDGTTGVFSQADPPAWRAGDRVRVIDGTMLVAG